MATESFDEALGLVLRHEGGYVDHPKDRGGATNLGITLGTLQSFRNRRVTKKDVRNLSREEAAKIYRRNYWDAVRGDNLPRGLDYLVFDAAVNSGPRRAIRWLQKALFIENADGIMDAELMAKVGRADVGQVINRFANFRLAFLRTLPTWSVFGKGWDSRVKASQRDAVRMAATPLGQ